MEKMTVGSLLGKPREVKTFAPDNRWVLPSALFGMEFEYEQVKGGVFETDPYLPTVWVTHKDDSLKDHGMEFVFANPLFGKDAYTAIVELMTKAKAHKFKCSRRAGIHVHLDVRDMETSQLVGLIILYAVLEPLIFRWIGENRENSIFCVPFWKADDSLIETISVVKGIIRDEKVPGSKTAYAKAYKFARYAGLNLQALAKFGSVEFRHMRTTHDVERVVDWINIIQSLKAATYKLPTSDGAIIAIAREMPANVFLQYVFGDELAPKLWTPEAEELLKTIGIPTARDLVLYGLTEMDWSDIALPEGKNVGFEKFLAATPNLKKEEKLSTSATAISAQYKKARYQIAEEWAPLPPLPKVKRAKKSNPAPTVGFDSSVYFGPAAGAALGAQYHPNAEAPPKPAQAPLAVALAVPWQNEPMLVVAGQMYPSKIAGQSVFLGPSGVAYYGPDAFTANQMHKQGLAV